MQDYCCDHHLVIGNGFATSTGEDSASVREIEAHKKATGLTITLMHIDDLARLVRLLQLNVLRPQPIRNLFQNCVTRQQGMGRQSFGRKADNWPCGFWLVWSGAANEAVSMQR
jgi:hypothetical protein